MYKFLTKLAIRWFGAKIYLIDTKDVDVDKMKDWLFSSYGEGWKHYYTIRKKYLNKYLSVGLKDNNEYWKTIGKLEELRVLNTNIKEVVNARKEKPKK